MSRLVSPKLVRLAVGASLAAGLAAVPLPAWAGDAYSNPDYYTVNGIQYSVPGFSCDEYPFASTYEGAASGGTARSFPNCLFLDPPATGSSGYSRCMISATENLSAGATLGNVYTGQRILDGDPLFVSITN